MRRSSGVVLVGLVFVPALALVPAAVLDRGPDGSVRGTVFHVALAASDPFVWACVRNSAAAAAAVAAGSLVGGVGLARIATRWRFWGRGPLAALAWAPMAVTPLFGAIGLKGWLGLEGAWAGAWPAAGVPWGWLGLIWLDLACGVPLVAVGARRALRRVDPAWEEAARWAGASRRQVWRGVVWPLVRPDAARGAAAVFVLALMEPGVPLVLGLRRSLAFQAVEAACSESPAPRAAVLALTGLALALVGRVLVHWWGGDRPPGPGRAEAEVARARRAEWPLAAAFTVVLGAWVAVAWLPALALVLTAAGGGGLGTRADQPPSAAASQGLVADPEALGLLARSLALGVAVGGLNLVLARGLAAPSARPRLAATAEAIPPLVLGVGARMLPPLLGAWADALHAGRTASSLGEGLRRLAEVLDPYGTPGALLAWAVAVSLLPVLGRADGPDPRRTRRAQVDAARTLGASRRRARRTAAGSRLGSPVAAAWVLTAALAATNVAPALVLEPTTEAQTVGPALVLQADEPGGGLRRAAALACCALALNLAAFALVARGRSGRGGAGQPA
ncbi:MAG TPA: Fe3+ ABC transporter permease [Isosphaeraceae bacterium]